MKFFTKEFWASTRDGEDAEQGENPAGSRGKVLRAYHAQLEAMRPRLPEHVFAFFERVDIYEGELLRLDIADGSRPAPLGQPPRPWVAPGNHPVRVALDILDVYDQLVWTLRYRTVRRILVDFPAEPPLLYRDGEGFGDLGYHELTDAGDGFFRHEILYASGATVLVEFREVEVHSHARG
ncbi:hypothetical protein HH212_10385 [Massilia forsythiae]|uniref:Uncharacterized protein n=1 Tax=Massilia forsythiae TaxID=2728020 RepID=A0A7Z2VWT2_9BURK|nr:hypothetical protein [Massilia forsythiae]QJE00380.1 hypothetical protein HH212_10385 [Massilia forsythiae]